MKFPKTTALTVCAVIVVVLASASPSRGETPEEVYSFAEHLQKDGMFEAAAQQFLKFARENPTSRRAPSALERAAECLVDGDEVDKAISVLETLVDTYPKDTDLCKVKIRLGRLYQKTERYEEADRTYNDVVVTMPDCPGIADALLGKGEVLIALGNYTGAADVLSSLVENFIDSPAAPRASFQLAFCRRRTGQEAQALDIYQQICKRFPGDPLAGFASLEAARMFAVRGDTTGAISYYSNAKRYDAKVFFIPAAEEGATLLVAAGRHEEALAWYEELLARNDIEDPRTIHIKAVRAAFRAGDDAGVRRIADDYVRRYPKTFSPQITYFSALTSLRRGEFPKAIQSAEAIETFAPGTEWARKAPRIKGEALLETGNPREAVSELRRFVSVGADSMARVAALDKIADIHFAVTRDTASALSTLLEMLDAEHRAVPSEIARVAAEFESARNYKRSRELYVDLVNRFPLSSEAEQAEERIRFLDDFRVTDPAAAARAMDAVAYKIARLDDWPALLAVAEARIEVLKEFEAALALCTQLEKSAKKTRYYPQVLYLEGLSRSKLALVALHRGDEKQARKLARKAGESWEELTKNHGASTWAAAAAFEELALRSTVENELDTARVQRVLSAYPEHPGRAAVIELLADRYLKQNNPALAKRYYRRALSIRKDDDGLRYKYATALSRAGEYKPALEVFENLAKTDRGRVGVRSEYEAGRAFRALKRYGDAVAYFERAADRDPSGALGVDARIQAADCRYAQGEYETALGQYRRATVGGKQRWDVGYRVALCLEQLGRAPEALAVLEKILAEKGGSGLRAPAYEKAADLAQRLHDQAKETAFLEAFVAEGKGGEAVDTAARRLARLYLHLGRAQDAADLAQGLARRAKKDDLEPKAILAMAYYRMGKTKDARNLAAEVAREAGAGGQRLVDETAVEAAQYHYDRKEYKEAVAAVAPAADRCRGEGVCERARYLYAVSLFGDGKLDEGGIVARSFFKEYPLSELSPKLHLKMGNVLAVKNRTAESLLHYEEAASTAEDSATVMLALKNLGVSYQKLKRWNEAEVVWARLLDRFAGSDYAREAALNVARCKMESGDYTGAIAAYEESLPLLDSEAKARAFYWMGQSYEQLGDFQSAVVQYLKVPYLHSQEGLWVVTAELKAAECYRRLERNDAAREIYKKVLRNHGANSNWGKIAQKGLDAIENSQQSSKD